MRLWSFELAPSRAVIAVIVVAPLLAGCASSGSGDRPSLGDRIFGAKPASSAGSTASTEYGPDYFLKRGYCPPVEIRPGTEAIITYERNHDGDPAYIRHQGSIVKTARECQNSGGSIQIKVGVAGRVVAGPKGGAGNVTLPLRIAVVKQAGSTVLYSQMFKIPVTLAAPDFGSDYSYVTDQVVINVAPEDRDLIVYVGFDEGKPKQQDEFTG